MQSTSLISCASRRTAPISPMRLRRRARFGAAPALHRPLRHAPKASLTRPYPSVLSSRTASPSRARLDLEDDASAIASTERSTVLTVLHQQLLVVDDGDVLLLITAGSCWARRRGRHDRDGVLTGQGRSEQYSAGQLPI